MPFLGIQINPAEFRLSLLVILLRCYPGLDEKETTQSESGVCVWVCGWGGGCSDDCGLDLRLTTWEERLVCFHNIFLMTQVHAALMTYILFAS